MSLKSKFCPKCGEEVKNLVKGLCDDCFKERTPVGNVPDVFQVEVCPKCGRYMEKNRWLKGGYLKGVLKSLIQKSLTFKGKGKVKIMIDNELTEATIRAEWFMDEDQTSPKLETYLMPLKIKKRLCDACFRRFSGYYVSVIQLRGEPDEVDKAYRKISSLQDRGGDMWFISKIEETKGGINVHIGSKEMDKEVEQMFKGKVKEIKRSYSLVTKIDGNDVYRNTVLVRL